MFTFGLNIINCGVQHKQIFEESDPENPYQAPKNDDKMGSKSSCE